MQGTLSVIACSENAFLLAFSNTLLRLEAYDKYCYVEVPHRKHVYVNVLPLVVYQSVTTVNGFDDVNLIKLITRGVNKSNNFQI